MPTWKELLAEIQAVKPPAGAHDVVRKKYLRRLHKLTGRNVIVYYSGWLQKPELQRQGFAGFEVNDSDKNGFMAAINKLDRSKGLDLLLHTPGGTSAATESLVHYLRAMFENNIRAVIPQIAMSAGTMVALACKQILMGKHSSLGPIDPQIGGLPAHGIIEEFERAATEISHDPSRIPVWQPIIANYSPTLIGECERAIQWSEEMVKEWLLTGMFSGEKDAKRSVTGVLEGLSYVLTKSHARHISMERAKELGLKVLFLEENDELQDAVLTVHHACIQTLMDTPALKIIENHLGAAFIQVIRQAVVQR